MAVTGSRKHIGWGVARWFRRRRLAVPGGITVAAMLVTGPDFVVAQTVSTVREVEFRSRWSNYNADQMPALRRSANGGAEEEGGFLPKVGAFFRNGPIVLRGSLTNGWEYSNGHVGSGQTRRGSSSSFFTAPAALAAYEREIGPWNVAFRYSAGYLRYLDSNYAPSGGGTVGGLSQTAAMEIQRRGSRLAFRTNASASSGSGFDIERNRDLNRRSIDGAIAADYSITEFSRAGVQFAAGYQTYSDDAGLLDDSVSQWAATLFAESILSGKTGLRVELGTGSDSHSSRNIVTREREYLQAVLRLNYQPTAKITLTPAVGFGLLDQTGSFQTDADGFRMIYSLAIEYVPTEKTSVRLFIGLEGAASDPELSLAINWHPRENTRLSLSAYQQTGFSTISDVSERTRRGALLTAQQRLFGRVTLSLGGGWEQEDTNLNGSETDPYYFFATSLGWQVNSWLAWQAQYRFSSGRYGFSGNSDSTESRAATSFQLTF